MLHSIVHATPNCSRHARAWLHFGVQCTTMGVVKLRLDLIGTLEASRMLGVDRSTITRRVARGDLEPVMRAPGERGAWLFRREDVEAAR